MINVDLFTNEELIDVRQEKIDTIVKVLPEEYQVDLSILLECEYELTRREGR